MIGILPDLPVIFPYAIGCMIWLLVLVIVWGSIVLVINATRAIVKETKWWGK